MHLPALAYKDTLPLLVVVIPALAGLLTYAAQERGKRNEALAKRKQELYESLIDSLVGLLGTQSGRGRSKLMSKIERGWLFAEDSVLIAYYAYLAEYDELCCRLTGDDGVLAPNAVAAELQRDSELRDRLGRMLGAVFAAMRKDILESDTQLDATWAENRLRIYSWGVIAAGEDGGPLVP